MALIENSKSFLLGKSVCPQCDNLSLESKNYPSGYIVGALIVMQECSRCGLEISPSFPYEMHIQGESDVNI